VGNFPNNEHWYDTKAALGRPETSVGIWEWLSQAGLDELPDLCAGVGAVVPATAASSCQILTLDTVAITGRIRLLFFTLQEMPA